MKKILIPLIAFIAIACNQTEEPTRKDGFSEVAKTKEDSVYKEVMEGHDIGMSKIIRVKRAISKSQHLLDSINALPKSKLDENYQQALMDLQEDLNYADYGMNTWMQEFKADTLQDNKESRIKYLESEKEKVNKVKDAILSGLKRADSLLKNYYASIFFLSIWSVRTSNISSIDPSPLILATLPN